MNKKKKIEKTTYKNIRERNRSNKTAKNRWLSRYKISR